MCVYLYVYVMCVYVCIGCLTKNKETFKTFFTSENNLTNPLNIDPETFCFQKINVNIPNKGE